MIKLDWVEGSDAVFGELGKDGAFVDKDFAEKHDLQVGSPVEITFANGNTETFVVKGIFDPPSGWLAVRRRHDLDRGLGRPEPEPEEHLLVRADGRW